MSYVALPDATLEEVYEAAKVGAKAFAGEVRDLKAVADVLTYRTVYSRERMRPREWIERFLKIRPTTGRRLIDFKFNASQRYVYARVLKQQRRGATYNHPKTGKKVWRRVRVGLWEDDDGFLHGQWEHIPTRTRHDSVPKEHRLKLAYTPGMVRMIILKARQQGMSTLFQGLCFEELYRTNNFHARLVSHEEESAEEILAMQKVFLQELPWKTPMKSDATDTIVFDQPIRSSVAITSAKADNPGRGGTKQFGHFTEVAFWGPKGYTLMNALRNLIHEEPGTWAVLESTANGTGNYFFEQWGLAEQDRSSLEPIFIPWFWSEQYRLEISDEEHDDIKATLDDEELWLLEQTYFRRGHGEVKVGYEQLAWRRKAIVDKSGGRVEDFKQEYPAYPEEAFRYSGRMVFEPTKIRELMRQLPTKLEDAERRVKKRRDIKDDRLRGTFTGEILIPDHTELFSCRDVGDWLDEHRELDVIYDPRGRLTIWDPPVKGLTYFMGIDSSAGLRHGDYAVIYVIEGASENVVAKWRGWIEPKILGQITACLHRWYNWALVGPEINNHGISVLDSLIDCQCSNIYRRRAHDKLERKPSDLLGWDTREKSKQLAIDHMRNWISQDRGDILCRDLLLECQGFHLDERGKMQPPDIGPDGEAGHDDCIMAFAITLQMREWAYQHQMISFEAETKKTAHELMWEHEEQSMGFDVDDDQQEELF